MLISPGAAAAALYPLQAPGAVWARQGPAMHRCCHLHRDSWCSLAWLKGTVLQVPAGPGDTEAPQCCPAPAPETHPGGRERQPRGIPALLLADPELINSTKAAWLGSSPGCRRGVGQSKVADPARAQGKEAAGRCRGGCGDREVAVMEPEFKK